MIICFDIFFFLIIGCADPVGDINSCPVGYNFSWSTEYCDLNCTNGNMYYFELKARWCALLGMPNPCQQCPGKEISRK